jgi:transforming growth factor-beta-induced protein
VDNVLTLPQIVSVTATATNMTTFVSAMKAAGSTERIDSTQDVTVFVPRNDAFSSVGSAFGNSSAMQHQQELMRRQNSSANIANIVNYHAVDGTVLYSSDLKNETMPTMAGKDVTITVVNGVAWVNSARVVGTDILVNNGVVHIIDKYVTDYLHLSPRISCCSLTDNIS